MIFLRSLLFNIVFYLLMGVTLILLTPVFFLLPPRWCMALVGVWARVNLFLLRVICGTRHEMRGTENLPKGGFILAGKHQSLWETFALLEVLRDPAYVIKRELLYLPIWGWWAWKARMIFVSRGKGTAALRQVVSGARRELKRGRPILIFPEGTRRPVGATPDYKFGIAHLYRQLNVPVVPAALNSGLFWPRRTMLRYPGTIVVEFLPAVPPGLAMEEFRERVERAIEAASDRLLIEAARSDARPPLPLSAKARLAELGA